MQYAFKCRNCGHLEDPGNAGERTVPAACRNCGAGVHFDPKTGLKAYDEDNWIVLADLPATELTPILRFHGITRDDIVAHEPEPSPQATREPEAIERTAEETLGAEDHAS